MNGWDQLAIGAVWPRCGHPKTPENTQSGHKQSPRCKECHRQLNRDYWERRRALAAERVEVANPDARAAELGGEFVAARQRWLTLQKMRAPRR